VLSAAVAERERNGTVRAAGSCTSTTAGGGRADSSASAASPNAAESAVGVSGAREVRTAESSCKCTGGRVNGLGLELTLTLSVADGRSSCMLYYTYICLMAESAVGVSGAREINTAESN